MDIDNYLNTQNWFNYQGFYAQIGALNYKTLVEVGVWKGHSISYLAERTRGQVFAVDLWDEWEGNGDEIVEEQIPFIYEIYQRNVAHVRDKIIDMKMHSLEAVKHFNDKEVDFVFIDGDHSYEGCLADLHAWGPKIRRGGIIAGHDYFSQGAGVKQAVDEVYPNAIKKCPIWWQLC